MAQKGRFRIHDGSKFEVVNLETIGEQVKMDDNTTAQDLKDDFNEHLADYASTFPNNAGAHNLIFRGKHLGSSPTLEQYQAIADGTFKDLYLGDYWSSGGVDYIIAAFNYYLNTGNTALTDNHLTLITRTPMYTHVMNDTNTTDGGYTGSKMYSEGLDQAKNIIRGVFGTHLVRHRQYLSNAVTSGEASAAAWVDSEVELMNEMMVYGSVINGVSQSGQTNRNVGVRNTQLPLFRARPNIIESREHIWLSDVVSASRFALVTGNGNASDSSYASHARGVLPAFSIS